MSKILNTNQRIRLLVDRLTEGNAARFAKSIGVVQQRFDRLLKPNKKTDKYPAIQTDISDSILQTYPNVSNIWLHSGEGPMMRDQLQDPRYGYNTFGIPYYKVDFIDGFNLIEAKDPKYIDYYIDIKAYNHADFWCEAAGDMVAMKQIHDKQNDILYGEIYGIVTKGFCTLKRIVRGKNDRYIKIVSVNPNNEHTEQEILLSKIEHIFLVLCCIKKL